MCYSSKDTLARHYFSSRYIIDGIEMPLTPAQLLSADSGSEQLPPLESIIDESVDPAIIQRQSDPSKITKYLSQLRGLNDDSRIEPCFAAQQTKAAMFASLVDAMWTKGPFQLENLALEPTWTWQEEGIGSMAAFYASVSAVAEACDDLLCHCRKWTVKEGQPSLSFTIPKRGERLVADAFVRDEDSWIIYVPFSTAAFRLGGSLLNHSLSLRGGIAPTFEDPDYFIDCIELVREFVEDGIALSARTVYRGGLLLALDSMCGDNFGAAIDIADLLRAYPSSNSVAVLFGEVPGVLFQIQDADFDYIDAEFLLQDVMYFPLGHVTDRQRGRRSNIAISTQDSLGSILSALVR